MYYVCFSHIVLANRVASQIPIATSGVIISVQIGEPTPILRSSALINPSVNLTLIKWNTVLL